MVKPKKYVGLDIRDEIKSQRITNGFIIHKLKSNGIKMTDTKFSNKIYGDRDKFTEKEIKIINAALGTSFSL